MKKKIRKIGMLSSIALMICLGGDRMLSGRKSIIGRKKRNR